LPVSSNSKNLAVTKLRGFFSNYLLSPRQLCSLNRCQLLVLDTIGGDNAASCVGYPRRMIWGIFERVSNVLWQIDLNHHNLKQLVGVVGGELLKKIEVGNPCSNLIGSVRRKIAVQRSAFC
jgi:hypothetical protein